jgi:anti-anti-sigma factor
MGRITTAVDGNTVRVRLVGEFDLALARDLQVLNEDLARVCLPVIVDAADLAFGDATLVGFLAVAAARDPVRVEAASRLLRDLLQLTGLSEYLDIAP